MRGSKEMQTRATVRADPKVERCCWHSGQVKLHRKDPYNEKSRTLADERRTMEDNYSKWTRGTSRRIFSSRKEGDHGSSAWTQGVQKWIHTSDSELRCGGQYAVKYLTKQNEIGVTWKPRNMSGCSPPNKTEIVSEWKHSR